MVVILEFQLISKLHNSVWISLSQITKKNAEIKRLKSSIKGVVNLAEDRNRRVKVDAHNQQMQDKQSHDSKASALKEEISVLTKKLQDLTAENGDKEQSLRKVIWMKCNHSRMLRKKIESRILCTAGQYEKTDLV